MNLNKLNLIILFFVSANIYCAEKAPKLSAKKDPTLKITNFFKQSKAEGNKEYKLASLPVQIKPKLGIALFSGKEINHFLASAIMNMQPGSQALMSLYDACYHSDKLAVNPLLQAFYNQYKKGFAVDTQVIVDRKRIMENPQFLLFNKFLKSMGCQVNRFEPTKLIDGESSMFQKPAYGSLHQKFYVFDKCLPNDSSSEKSALAVITSHNPTAAGIADDQLNDALVIASPTVIDQLRKRFKFIQDTATVEFSEDLKASPELTNDELDFKSADFGKLNLLKIDSNQVELLASPLRITDQSLIPKIVEEIDQETKCIQIASFQFSHANVVEALIKALERGVRVECVIHFKCLFNNTIDGGNVHNLAFSRLKNALHENNNNGFMKVESAKFLHHKFYTFQERQTVITGSLNCTGNSEKNCAEVDVKIADQENYDAYHNYFAKLASTAEIPKLTNLESVHQRLIESKNYSYKINGWKP
jgi:phosphatidylserine/phosphatidylglycerophosphate/cardiolipin synthase-like enzyme